jgi:transposase InsO family protein
MAYLFITHVWKLHGLPKRTISDQGTVFNSHFLKQLYKRLDIKPSFSTAYWPQTDGQSKRSNQILEAYLRHYVSHRQNDWAALLPVAEFAYDNGVQASTGQSPFFTCYGFHPRLTVSNEEDDLVPAAENHA